MKIKTKQVIVIVSMIIMVVIIGVSVFKNDDLFPKNNVWSNKKETKENTEAKEEESLIVDNELEEDKTFEIGEDVLTDDLIFKVNSVEKTKERKQFPKPPNWERFVTDENGNLINNLSYIIINVTIKNNRETTRMFPLNSCWLNVMDDKNQVYNYECIMSSKLEDFDKKDYFEYNFQPKEEYTCDLVYIVEDEILQYNNLIFNINISGAVGYDDDSRYVKIKY